MSIKVSIIIPIYNRATIVGFTLSSIQNQSYKNFECILIDDGSKDNTIKIVQDIIKDDTRFKILKRIPTYVKGPAGCRNMGLDIAKGEYIQFFDSDDLMSIEHIEDKVAAFSSNTDMVVCQLSEFNTKNPNYLYGVSYIDDKNDLLKHITGEVNYYLPGPMWKKSVIGNNRFLTDIHIYEDLLFNLTIRILCKEIKVINKSMIYYRRHDETTTAKVHASLSLLNEKRIAWKSIYNLLYKQLDDFEQISQLRSVMFKNSVLNFYYILCNKSFVLAYRGFKDICFYSNNKSNNFIIIKLLFLSPFAFLFSKGYRFYKIEL